MRALIYDSFQGALNIESVPDPHPPDTGVVLKVNASGICRSDWHGWMGHDKDIILPHVPGHELAGIIVEIGKDVKNFIKEQRVTVPFVGGCGKCEYCNSGNQQVCNNQFQPGFTHWGSFAEYVAIDFADENLVLLPDQIDDATAALLGCRFITSYRAIIDQGRLEENQFIAIHGCGGIGLSALLIAKAQNAITIAIDINENALQKAKALGADYTINASGNTNIPAIIKDISSGGAHLSIDALGSQITSFNSISCLRKRGRHIQIGLMTGDHAHSKVPMDLVLSNELEIYGSHGMQAHRYPPMLEMILDQKLKPNLLINQLISLESAPSFLANMGTNQDSGVTIITQF